MSWQFLLCSPKELLTKFQLFEKPPLFGSSYLKFSSMSFMFSSAPLVYFLLPNPTGALWSITDGFGTDTASQLKNPKLRKPWSFKGAANKLFKLWPRGRLYLYYFCPKVNLSSAHMSFNLNQCRLVIKDHPLRFKYHNGL